MRHAWLRPLPERAQLAANWQCFCQASTHVARRGMRRTWHPLAGLHEHGQLLPPSRSRHRHRLQVSRPDACRDGSSQRLEHRILAAPGRCASVEMRCRTRGRIRSCPGQISRNPPCKSPDLARCDRECNVRPTQSQLQRTATGNSRAGRLVTRASAHARSPGGVRRFLTCPRVVLGDVANQEEKR